MEVDYYGCPNCGGDGQLDEHTFCDCQLGQEMAREYMTPDEIRALRARLGLTQAQLAERIRGIDPLLKTDFNAVSRYERGSRRPDPHVAAALARIAESAPSSLDR